MGKRLRRRRIRRRRSPSVMGLPKGLSNVEKEKENGLNFPEAINPRCHFIGCKQDET